MTIYLVECSGGEWEDYWHGVEKCFLSKDLADEYIEKKKNIIKNVQNKEKEFNEMLDAFCDEISADSMPECGHYFDVYGASFEDFIIKLETYKERNTVINNFFNTFDKEFIKKMHKWFITNNMLYNSCRSCNIDYWVRPMHVYDKVEL